VPDSRGRSKGFQGREKLEFHGENGRGICLAGIGGELPFVISHGAPDRDSGIDGNGYVAREKDINARLKMETTTNIQGVG